MSDKKKKCPDCVIDAGGLMIKLRHALKAESDAAKVGVKYGEHESLWKETWESVMKAMDHLHDEHGIAMMEFGPGLQKLLDVQDCGHGTYGWVACLCAHNEFKKVLDKYGIENPTNQQLVRTAGLLNKR